MSELEAAEKQGGSESRLRQMVDRSPVGIFHTTPQGRLIDANQAFFRIVGYPSLAAVNEVGVPNLYENPAVRQRLIAQLQEGAVTGFDTRFRRSDGSLVDVLISVQLIQDESGSYLEGILEDNTRHKLAEKAVADWQQRYELVTSASRQVVYDQDLSSGGITWSGNIEKILGYQLTDMKGGLDQWGELIHPDDQDDIYRLRTAARDACSPYEIEYRFRRKDGAYLWIHDNGLFIPDASGQAAHMIGLMADITERKQAEQARQESEQRFRTVADFTYSWETWLAPDGHYVYVSPACQRISGYPPQDFMDRPELFVAITHQDDRALVERHVREHGTTTEMEPLEYRILTQDGQVRWINHVCLPVYDARGHFQGRRGSNTDITARKQAEAAVQDEKNFSDTIVSSLPGVFYLINTQGQMVRFNEEYQTLLGYTPEQLHRLSMMDTIVEEDRARIAEQIQKVFVEGRATVEVNALTKDGRKIPYYLTGTRMTLGNDLYLVGMGMDITERKRLEREIQESLERRGRQVQTSTEVAQEIAAAPALDELFKRVVTLIKERFGYYHAQLFRYDPVQDAAVLVSGYGEAGKKMLAAGHKLTMGRGVVGTAAATSQPLLASDVVQDKSWRPNPNLPDTRGELAVPITIGSGNAETQLNTLKYFTRSDFDGFAVAAINPSAAMQVTREAVQHDKAVAVISINLGPDSQSSFIGADNYQMGYLLGTQAGTWAKEHLASGETLKLGMLNYRVSQDTIQRENGILDAIGAIFGSNVEVMVSGSAVETATATSLTQGWLQTHPDLRMILSINDDGALGAYNAARAAGYSDPERFFIGGIDGVPTALAAIQEGGVYQATVNQPPEIMGILVARVLIAKIKGRLVKPAYLIKCTPIDRHNVAKYLGPDREAVLLAEQEEIITTEIIENLDGSGLRLGLSVISLANPFFALLANSAQKEAQRLGAQLSSYDPRRILGVLDVQSDRAGALGTEDQLLLEGLCGQIAVAIENRRIEDALREREEDLNAMLEYSPEAVGMVNTRTGLFESVNQTAERLYGLNREELVKVGPAQMSPAIQPDGRPSVEAALEQINAALNGATPVFEWIHVNAAGQQIPCEVRLVGLTGARSHLVRFSVTDITERKQTEEALAAERNLIRTLIDTIPDLIYAKDADSRFILANTATAQRMGAASPIELIGKSDLDFYPAELAQQYFAAEQALIREGRSLIDIEDRAVDSTGQPHWHLSTKVPLRNQQGEIIGLIGTTRDITERKVEEEAVRASEEHFRAVTQSANYAIITANNAGVITNWNRGAENIFGYPGEAVVGQPLTFLMPERFRTLHTAGLARLEAGGEPHVIGKTVELYGLRQNGEEFPLELSLASWESGEGKFYTAIITDITARRESEAQMQETMRELERLYRATTHEGWQTFLQTKPALGYQHDGRSTQSVDSTLAPEMKDAIQHNTVVPFSPERSLAAVPLAVRGEVIGAVGIYNDPQRPLTPEELDLIQAISEQGALALESARLFEQTQHDAERERTINRIASRIRSAQSVDQVLEIAAQELSSITHVSRSVVEILPAIDQPTSTGNGEGVKV